MDNLYENEFERYLKEQADLFKMEPDKKVWHGIYNNFHPGRRWPSIATGLMIILLLTLTNSLNTRQRQELLDNFNSEGKQLAINHNKINKSLKTANNKKDDIISENIISDLLAMEDLQTKSPILSPTTTDTKLQQPGAVNNYKVVSAFDNNLPNNIISKKENSENGRNTLADNINGTNQKILVSEELADSMNDNSSSPEMKPISFIPTELLMADKIPSTIPFQKTEFVNTIKKKINRHLTTFSFYAAPTLNYRKVGNSSFNTNDYSTNGIASSSYNVDQSTDQHIAAGFEIGSTLSFRLIKNLELFSGLQFNYSGYNISASYTHPVQSFINIARNGIALQQAVISNYSNQAYQAPVKLHTYNLEASVPIGIKYSALNYDRLSFNLYTAVAPTFVLLSKSYLLSSDTRNYVSYPELTRNINMNGEMGFTIGLRKQNLKYEIGPEFRYQLFSNYKNRAPYSEHLINYGIKFVITH